jgi:sulfur carrier protein ThiS
MTVHVELFGAMRRPWRERQREVEISGRTVGDLLRQLGYGDADTRCFSLMVNGVRAQVADDLADGDRVTVILVLGGG